MNKANLAAIGMHLLLAVVVGLMVATVAGYGEFASFGVVWLAVASPILIVTIVLLVIGACVTLGSEEGTRTILNTKNSFWQQVANVWGVIGNLTITGTLIYLGYVVMPTIYILLWATSQAVTHGIYYIAKQAIKEHEQREAEKQAKREERSARMLKNSTPIGHGLKREKDEHNSAQP